MLIRNYNIFLFYLIFLLIGCNQKQTDNNSQIPPPNVITATASLQQLAERFQFIGRVVALERVELRARVVGFLQERRFKEGQTVRLGETLFLIEPEQYLAAVEQKRADLAKALAEEENARAQLARGQELLKTKNISLAEVDKLKAAQSIAQASIAQAKAAQAAAELNLSYTKIQAPLTGRIGLANYPVGNLVGPDSGILATLVSQGNVYVQFPITHRERLEARRDLAAGKSAQDWLVKVKLPDGNIYNQVGRLNFMDITTDAGTDTVLVRAMFPNPEEMLLDGQYLTVLLEDKKPTMALLIPQAAIQIDQQGSYVLIIDQNNYAQMRRIQTGAPQEAKVAVTQGLQAGELVIIEGAQKVRPGQAVHTTPTQEILQPVTSTGEKRQ